MQLLYNSDSYTVVQFELPAADAPPGRGGFEILDKRAGREIYLRGPLAETFERGVQQLVRGDMAARGVFYNKLFNMGSLSPNDIRAREGEPEVEGGDIYLVPMNMVSLENAGKPQAKKGVRPAPAPAEIGRASCRERVSSPV